VAAFKLRMPMKIKQHLLKPSLIAKALAVILLPGCKNDEQKHVEMNSKMNQAVEKLWIKGCHLA
jgi:hypothetical protein